MQSAFTELLTGPHLGAVPAAQKMASIYATYAATGTFGPNLPVFTGLEQSVMAATLAAVFALPVPNPAAWGTAWSAAVTTFWLSPPIVVVGPTPGTVTACPGAGAIVGALLAQVLIPFSPAPVAAAYLAGVLHTATSTTIATLNIPPPTPTPIS